VSLPPLNYQTPDEISERRDKKIVPFWIAFWVAANLAASADAEYQVFCSRAGNPRTNYVWPIKLQRPLPVIGIPLGHGDADVPLHFQSVMDEVYDVNLYESDFDYHQDLFRLLHNRIQSARERKKAKAK